VAITSAMASATAGMRGAVEHMRRDAVQIAGSRDVSADVDALVHLKVDELQVAANARVIRAADEGLGRLLDILA